jgi:hypothetical protein
MDLVKYSKEYQAICNEIFKTALLSLLEKYGDDFIWWANTTNNVYYESEAKREIKQGHPLYEKSIYYLAKCEINDDVIFGLDNGSYVIIHLTFAEYSLAGYPKFQYFSDIKNIICYIEKQYIDEYL